VTVFDVAGRCVLGQSAISNLKSEIAFDLRSLSAGVYLVRLSADGYNSSQRLVVLAR